MLRLATVLLTLTALPAAAAGVDGAVIQLTPADDWLGVINGEGLAPGTTVVLGGGTYVTPDAVMLDIAHVGTAQAPITIMAAPGETAVLTRNTIGAFDDFFENLEHNVVNMRGAQHVVLQGLEITGGNWGIRIGSKTNGLNKSDDFPMGDILRPAMDITIRGCHIHHTHNTAISANFRGDVYERLHIVENDIHHAGRWGESIYLGNTDGGWTRGIAKDCVIERNHLHDNVWEGAWFQDPDAYYHGTAIQLKDGCYGNTIRGNVMHYTFYPAVLISGAQSGFGWKGVEGWGPNVVEGNIVWQVSEVPGDLTGQGLQIAADAVVRNNIVYAAVPFLSSDHGTQCGGLEIVGNTFITSTPDGVEPLLISNEPFDPILIANNALYRAPGDTLVINGTGSYSAKVTQVGNVAITDLGAALADAAGLDFFPVAGSPLVGAADVATLPEVDFNGTDRAGDATAGAYAFDPAGNPGWEPSETLTHATAFVRNGSGQNPLGFQSTSAPLLGEAWTSTVDISDPYEIGSLLIIGLGGPSWGPVLTGEPAGELLVQGPYTIDAGLGVHAIDVPDFYTAIGIAVSTQAVTIDISGPVLQNGIDLVLGTY